MILDSPGNGNPGTPGEKSKFPGDPGVPGELFSNKKYRISRNFFEFLLTTNFVLLKFEKLKF